METGEISHIGSQAKRMGLLAARQANAQSVNGQRASSHPMASCLGIKMNTKGMGKCSVMMEMCYIFILLVVM